jgi:hypothetical protein
MTAMKRTDPTFKEQTVIDQENIDFLDEMFAELFDCGDVSSDSDIVPDLSILDKVRETELPTP